MPNGRSSHARKSTASAGEKEKYSRPPLERMKLLKEMIESEKFPNCRGMAEALEVSQKTVQRDLEFMRDRFQMPIEYSATEYGYFFDGSLTQLIGTEISEGEIAALYIAQAAMGQHRGTPLEKALRSACGKLVESLRDKISLQWSDVEAAFSFRSAGVSRAETQIFEQVSRAVLDSRELVFHYHKLHSPQMELRRAHPYHIACVENQWYCFALDQDRQQMRTFSLVRMSRVKVTAKRFERPADFSIRRHLGDTFGVFRSDGEGKAQTVRIRFDAWAARLVAEREWHETQEIRPIRGGGIELRLSLSSFEEIERWILSWGEHAEVLAPARLRSRVREIAAAIAERG